MIQATHPHRIVPKRRRPNHFPYDEHPEIQTPGRAFPCGHHDGGYMFGDGDDCRDADVQIEDWVGPPLYTERQRGTPRNKMMVESTHTETRTSGVTEEGRTYRIHTLPHPKGLR